MVKLGLCYKKSIGIEKNLREAISLYTAVVNQQNTDVPFKVGQYYAKDLTNQKKLAKILQFYQLAASQEQTETCVNSKRYHNKESNLAKNSRKAVDFYVLGEKRAVWDHQNPPQLLVQPLAKIDKHDTEDGDCEDNNIPSLFTPLYRISHSACNKVSLYQQSSPVSNTPLENNRSLKNE